MSHSRVLNRHKEIEADHERPANPEKDSVLADIYKHINECRKQLNREFISEATRASYESMFAEYVADKNLAFAESSVRFAKDTADRAGREFKAMKDILGKQENLVTDEDAREMEAWFKSDDMLDMVRTKSWEQKTQEFIQKYATVATRRAALEKRLTGLTEDDAEEISVLRDSKSFLKLSLAERNGLMSKLEALDIASVSGQKELFREANTLLKQASTGKDRYLHPASTGILLKQMMASGKPEKFKEQTLLPSLETYRGTRTSFDGLQAEFMAAEHAPIATPKLDTFLNWNAERRSSFIAEGHRRLNMQADEKESADEELALLKKLTEKSMRLEDWKGAEAFLEDAQTRFPEDKDLTVMRRYLNNHRTDLHAEQTEEDMERISNEIDVMITKVSPEMRTIYIAMAMQGPDAFRAFAESMERGALQKKKDESQDALADDEVRSAVAREIPGGPEESDETNDENVTVARETYEDQMKAVKEVTDDGEAEKTLKFARISAEIQERHARNISRPLLTKLYELQDKGGDYGKAA